jgi:uncharacterized protein (TIGR02145 family)
MKRLLFIPFSVVFAIFILLSSCKKEETEKSYMTGTITFNFPVYSVAGQSVSMYCTGVTSPQGISYYWTSSDMVLNEVVDTIWGQSITLTLPEAIGEYHITAHARYAGYYDKYTLKSTIVIDPSSGGSITGIVPGTEIFTDPRDNQQYYTRTIGNLKWFTQDLRYVGTNEEPVGSPYEKASAISLVFGCLYSWDDATGGVAGEGLGGGPQGACPEGWSVPTKEDWEDLAKAVSYGVDWKYEDNWTGLAPVLNANAYFNGERVWPYCPESIPHNSSGWNALPCGNSSDTYETFQNLLLYGMWWSSMETDGGKKGSYRYIYYNMPDVNTYHVGKEEFGVSVRCVKLAN